MKDIDLQSKSIYLKDYQQPDFLIGHVDLTFELHEEQTRVVSVMQISKNTIDKNASLILMGECLELGGIKVDDTLLDVIAYEVTDITLTVLDVPDKFTLEIETFIKPQENFSLEFLFEGKPNLKFEKRVNEYIQSITGRATGWNCGLAPAWRESAHQ